MGSAGGGSGPARRLGPSVRAAPGAGSDPGGDTGRGLRTAGHIPVGAAAPGHVAIDGKRLRGSAAGDHDGSEGVHLLAVFATRLGAVIGQLRVASEANEITTALALLKSLPLEGAIITGDAALSPA